MELLDFLTPSAELSSGSGPEDHVVLSSRVRLARNVVGVPFPGRAKKQTRQETCDKIKPLVSAASAMRGGFTAGMEDLKALDKQLLVERHLISREHAAKGGGSALILNKDETLSVMVNEEDHLRMQALMPGMQIKQVWQKIDRFDTSLEKKIDYGYDVSYGYLTACPTNLGTGIRVSAMLHLPGLVLTDQVNQIVQAVTKLGHAVRGLYGEGTEALGHIFQVSNQMTLGESEGDIIERIHKVVLQIIEHETNARANLQQSRSKELYNHVGRAYGVLANAHIVSSKESMNQLSLIRLGVKLGMFEDLDVGVVDELFLVTQPAHLQQLAGEKLSGEERDLHRANLLRERLSGVKGVQYSD
jgi:protein arginine kinase